MTRRSNRKPAAAHTPPTLSIPQALNLIRRQIEKGEEALANRPVTEEVKQAWGAATRNALVEAYGSASPNVANVMNIGRIGDFWAGGGNEQQWEAERAKYLRQQITVLREFVSILELKATPEWAAQNSTPSESDRDPVSFVKCIFPGGFSMAKQIVTAGGDITVRGDFVVADSIRDSFDKLGEPKAGPGVKDLLQRLGEAIIEQSKTLSPEQQQELAQDFKTLTTEAAKDKPMARYLKTAADGIKAVAATVGNTVVTSLVTALLAQWGIS